MEACNAWAKSHGVDAHKHGVEFRASPLGGLGAFATKAINAGDTLLLLPRGFAVTPYVCEVALQDSSLARSPRAAVCRQAVQHKAFLNKLAEPPKTAPNWPFRLSYEISHLRL